MGIYIKNWSLADWKELLKWAKIGANNAMIGEFAEVEEIPPHGDLIDRDVLTAKFKGMGLGEHSLIERLFADGVYVMIDYAPTIIPTSEEEMK